VGDGDGIVGLVADAAGAGLLVDFHDEIEVVFLLRPRAELEHLGEFIRGVDMQHGKRDVAVEGLVCEPDEHVGILAHGPGHADFFEEVIGLTENEDALVLQGIEVTAVILIYLR